MLIRHQSFQQIQQVSMCVYPIIVSILCVIEEIWQCALSDFHIWIAEYHNLRKLPGFQIHSVLYVSTTDPSYGEFLLILHCLNPSSSHTIFQVCAPLCSSLDVMNTISIPSFCWKWTREMGSRMRRRERKLTTPFTT